METHFETSSAEQTKEVARNLVKVWMNPPSPEGALVIGLEGELGSGKTTFVQGAMESLGVENRVTSPTFVLMKRYEGLQGRNLYHIDCYRLDRSKDLLSLGWNDIIKDPKNVVFVEWADRVKDILPEKRYTLSFQALSPEQRSIKAINAHT
ncbi:MAG: tRNA (adenosine(37)-N6)-threonylcarbamoyltransferase complex ATPase subunit type 1 TsaE [bacterium]|nr:tRNA (adenosine(37)-N6)-threonylcarbamoyltransferase complex ATPase subunit type 1 TsaE [bacterium]